MIIHAWKCAECNDVKLLTPAQHEQQEQNAWEYVHLDCKRGFGAVYKPFAQWAAEPAK